MESKLSAQIPIPKEIPYPWDNMPKLPAIAGPFPIPLPPTLKEKKVKALAEEKERVAQQNVRVNSYVNPDNTPRTTQEIQRLIDHSNKASSTQAIIRREAKREESKELTQHQAMLERLKNHHYSNFTREEHDYLVMQAQNRAYTKLVYQMEMELVRRDMEDNADLYFGENTPLSNHVKEAAGAGSASRYVFWTINIQPDKQSNIENILTAIEKTSTKKWIARWAANIEQRGVYGQDNFGTGIHVNFLTEKKQTHIKKRLSEMEKEMKNTWKNFAQVSIPGILTSRPSPDPTNFLNYLRGIKADDEKAPLVDSDRIWRLQYNNPPIPDVMGNWEEVAHFGY